MLVYKKRLPHLLPTGTHLSPPGLEPPNPSCLCVRQQFPDSTIIGQNLAPSLIYVHVVTPVYFHHSVQPRCGGLPHTVGMCRIATGISAASTDAASEKKNAYKAADRATVFLQTPARHALSITVHAEPCLIH